MSRIELTAIRPVVLLLTMRNRRSQAKQPRCKIQHPYVWWLSTIQKEENPQTDIKFCYSICKEAVNLGSPSTLVEGRNGFCDIFMFCTTFDVSPVAPLTNMAAVGDVLLRPCVCVLLSVLYVSFWDIFVLEIRAPRIFAKSRTKTPKYTASHPTRLATSGTSRVSANETDFPSTDMSYRLHLHTDGSVSANLSLFVTLLYTIDVFFCLFVLIETTARLPKCSITLSGPVVTICTASLTFNNSTFHPRSVFMSFVWI